MLNLSKAEPVIWRAFAKSPLAMTRRLIAEIAKARHERIAATPVLTPRDKLVRRIAQTNARNRERSRQVTLLVHVDDTSRKRRTALN